MSKLRFGRYLVELSNTDKVLFPDSGITKGDLIGYYREIAGVMLPHLQGRPLTLHRFPDGIDAGGFYQQERPDYFPDWIETVATPRAAGAGDPVEHALCNKQATLAYLANQAVITLHGWLARAPRIGKPDRLTVEQRKNKRRGRIYLDVMRNAYGQTTVMPYAVRAKPGAPVATPLDLEELEDSRLDPRRWHLKNVVRRIGQKGDPWADIHRHAAGLRRARDALRGG